MIMVTEHHAFIVGLLPEAVKHFSRFIHHIQRSSTFVRYGANTNVFNAQNTRIIQDGVGLLGNGIVAHAMLAAMQPPLVEQ